MVFRARTHRGGLLRPAHDGDVIDARNLHTGEAQRDGHLKSADFLDVERYPQITIDAEAILEK